MKATQENLFSASLATNGTEMCYQGRVLSSLRQLNRADLATSGPLASLSGIQLCQSREGNSNPLQCSCLENPRDGGAWWAAINGVQQRPTLWPADLSNMQRSQAIKTPPPIHVTLLGVFIVFFPLSLIFPLIAFFPSLSSTLIKTIFCPLAYFLHDMGESTDSGRFQICGPKPADSVRFRSHCLSGSSNHF